MGFKDILKDLMETKETRSKERGLHILNSSKDGIRQHCGDDHVKHEDIKVTVDVFGNKVEYTLYDNETAISLKEDTCGGIASSPVLDCMMNVVREALDKIGRNDAEYVVKMSLENARYQLANAQKEGDTMKIMQLERQVKELEKMVTKAGNIKEDISSVEKALMEVLIEGNLDDKQAAELKRELDKLSKTNRSLKNEKVNSQDEEIAAAMREKSESGKLN